MDEFYGRGRATLSNIAYPAAPASTLDPTRLKGLRVIFRFQVTLGASILFFFISISFLLPIFAYDVAGSDWIGASFSSLCYI